MIIGGIDPGLRGAIFVINTETADYQVWDMPTLDLPKAKKNRRDIDEHSLKNILRDASLDHVFLERVWTQTGEGSVGAFSFGCGFGILRGVVATLEITTTFVTSQTWKKALSVKGEKDVSRSRASQLMPHAAHNWTRIMDHGRAEAALIAYYGCQSLGLLKDPSAYKSKKRKRERL